MKKRALSILSSAFCLSLIVAALVPLSASAATTTIYNNIPSPQPGNLPSQAFEATSTSEFGGQVSFAGTERQNPKVTVLMSSWGCETGHWTSGDCATTPGATFSVPITLNIYNVGAGNAPGTLVATTTKTFNIPYRPSADSTNCTGGNAGKWFDGTTCFNGLATPVSFDVTGTLPNSAIISVAYNTTHYGYTPVGTSSCSSTSAGCGYDSLNVALTAPPTVGTTPLPADAYLNSSWNGAYCDNGVGGTGTFRLDSGCWTGFQPAIKVEAAAPSPTNQDQCKKDGWKSFGTLFKNQGDCVSFVASKGKNQPSGH